MSDATPRVAALVAAAGGGTRLGLGPKAFVELGGRSLLARVLDTAQQVADEVLVAAPAQALDRAQAIAGTAARVIAGGQHRSESFRRLLGASRAPLVLLLDVSRPFVDAGLALRVLEAARVHGAAGAFVAARIPLALGGSGWVREAVPADAVRWPQMPQAFRREILQCAFDTAGASLPQTLWQLVIASGTPLMAVEGNERNIKITSSLDLELARLIAAGETAQ